MSSFFCRSASCRGLRSKSRFFKHPRQRIACRKQKRHSPNREPYRHHYSRRNVLRICRTSESGRLKRPPGLRKPRSAAQFPPSDDRTPVGSKTPGVRRGKCRRAMCESEPTAAKTRTGIPFPGASHHLPLPSRDNKPPGAGGSVIFTHGVARFSPNHPAGRFSAASPAPVRSPQPEPHPVLQNPYRRKLHCRDVRRRFLR